MDPAPERCEPRFDPGNLSLRLGLPAEELRELAKLR